MKNYTYFVGIDISKDKLDFAIFSGEKFLFHKETGNCVPEILALVADIKKLPKFTISRCLFGMEQTGIYSYHLKVGLKRVKANIVIEDASHIRSSLGNIRGKNDKVDAIRIGEYLFKNRTSIRIFAARRGIIDQLQQMMSLRSRFVNVTNALIKPINDAQSFSKKKDHRFLVDLCKNSTAVLKKDAKELDKVILSAIQNDANTKRLFEIITSVPNVGAITAIHVIIATNEFLTISNPKKFACHSGVAPFTSESGKTIRKARVSHMADKKMKMLLHLCALSAISKDPELKKYYQRKTKMEGKPKMAVVNAVRNKLILRVFACVNQNRLYEKDYVRPGSNFNNAVPSDEELVIPAI